jgi:hypothetical protein
MGHYSEKLFDRNVCLDIHQVFRFEMNTCDVFFPENYDHN